VNRNGATDRRRRRSPHVLVGLRVAHTLIWLSIESSVGYLLFAGVTRRTGGRVTLAGAVVAGECLVFVGNGFHCPLTDLAEHLGAERGSVTDLYLPAWFARNMPLIHVPLLVLAAVLYRRNLRRHRS
jgi:hypothetical protein